MLAEGLDQAVGLRQRPCLFNVLPRLLHALEAHQIHGGHEMHVDRRHGIQLRVHGQRQLRYGQRTAVVLLQIRLMGQQIAGPQLQAIRQAGEALLQIHITGHGQVQQHRSRRDRKRTDGVQQRRGLRPEFLLQIRQQTFKGAHGQTGFSPGKVGKEAHQVGRIAQHGIRAVQIGFHRPCSPFHLPAVVIILAPGDGPVVLVRNCLDEFAALPHGIGAVHEGHGDAPGPAGVRAFRLPVLRLHFLPVCGNEIRRDHPRLPVPYGSGNPVLPRPLLDGVDGYAQTVCRLPG